MWLNWTYHYVCDPLPQPHFDHLCTSRDHGCVITAERYGFYHSTVAQPC